MSQPNPPDDLRGGRRAPKRGRGWLAAKRSEAPDPSRSLIGSHPRTFGENRYVYPVLSRRAGGISIGVNLNLDRACDFDCIYCQVDRSQPGPKPSAAVDLDRLEAELDAMVGFVVSGRIFEDARFRATPPALRRLNDVALSGDAEPTTCPNFVEAAAACAEVRRRHGLDAVKLVLITNASLFHRARVRRGLEILDAANGEIWAKLDAGTEAYYREVARSKVPFRRILENLLWAARVRPIVIQTLLVRVRGEPPSSAELEAYCGRLGAIAAGGGRIRLVQLYTIARPAAETWATPLTDAELDALAALVRQRTGLPVATYYGRAANGVTL